MPPRMPFSINMCMSMSVKSSRFMLVYLVGHPKINPGLCSSEGDQVYMSPCMFF